jgi:very-short-patch-repair endonuclease
MPRVPLPHEIAARPFSTSEATSLGIGRERLRGADLERPFRGVRLPPDFPATHLNRCLALQARLPLHAYFSGVTAALIMGVPLPARLEGELRLHVSVARPRVAPTGRNIVGHVSSSAESEVWRGARVSPPSRMWCELARELDLADLVAAGEFLIHHNLPIVSAAELASAVNAWGRRAGCALLRESLPMLDDRSESRAESRLRVVLLLANITGLKVNMWIQTSTGFRYRGDLVFERERVIVEYQSRFHDTTKAFEADMTRKSRLEADGWHVFEVNMRDLDDPAELVARLRGVLAVRARA